MPSVRGKAALTFPEALRGGLVVSRVTDKLQLHLNSLASGRVLAKE